MDDTNEVSLVVKDLSLSIEKRPILKDINLTIPNNKITCIVGPSGCGKSTLLKTFNRLIDEVDGVEHSGKIMIAGRDILASKGPDLIELRRHIGLVPQKPCPLPMSIYENVAYGCRIHGLCRNRKELNGMVENYLGEVGLWDEVKDRLHSPAGKLSIGQQQRLCLARSLAVRPDFILADEATSALDPVSSKTVEDLFVKLKEKYTIIMVTHTLRQAFRIADYAVFIYLGEVIETGEAKQVFNDPKEELTRKYLAGVFS
jgi:phosphate transport system ATP-binding protein